MTDQQAREEKPWRAYLLCILIREIRTSLKAIEIPEGVTLENNQGILSFREIRKHDVGNSWRCRHQSGRKLN